MPSIEPMEEPVPEAMAAVPVAVPILMPDMAVFVAMWLISLMLIAMLVIVRPGASVWRRCRVKWLKLLMQERETGTGRDKARVRSVSREGG